MFVIFIKTTKPIETVLSEFLFIYNRRDVPKEEEPFNYKYIEKKYETLLDVKIEYDIISEDDESPLFTAYQQQGFIHFEDIDDCLAGSVIGDLLELYGWKNVKWVAEKEEEYGATI